MGSQKYNSIIQSNLRQVKIVIYFIRNLLLSLTSSLSFIIISREIPEMNNNLFEFLNSVINVCYSSDSIVFLLFLIAFFGQRKYSGKYNKLCAGFSVIFSLFLIVGKSYSQFGTWELIINGNNSFILTIFIIFGLSYGLYQGLIFFFWWVSNCSSLLFRGIYDDKVSEYSYSGNHKMTLYGMVFLMLCWIPYLIINLPGSVPYDGFRQINMAFGLQQPTNHHPFAITLLYRLLFSIGSIVSDNFGVTFIIAFNYTILSYACSFSIVTIYKWGVKRYIAVLFFLYFVFLPVWGAFAQAVIKDTIYCALFLLFFVRASNLLLKIIQNEKINKKEIILFSLFSLAVCLSRNNGTYIVIPFIGILIVTFKLYRRALIKTFAVIFLLVFGFNNIVLPCIGVESGSIKEMMSIPFQQVARYTLYFPDEITIEENNAITDIFNIQEASELGEKYNPDKSDPVKDLYRNDSTFKELVVFFRTWFSLFLKHPGVFVQASINNIYGYFYPPYICKVLLSYNYYIESKPAANTGLLDIHYYVKDSKIRECLVEYSELWQLLPGLSLFSSPGAYTWITLILFMLFIYYKKFSSMIILVIPFLHIVICCASPVNGLLRYALPIMAIMPTLICWSIKMVRGK